MRFKISVRVDLGKDLGQNFGSLFEASDEQGRVTAGAGFLGAYNTESRSDRRILHFFVRSRKRVEAQIEPLPRASEDGGIYLHAFDNRVFARSRPAGSDKKLRVWDAEARRWRVEEGAAPLSVHIGDGALAATSNRVTYRGSPVLELGPDEGLIGATYYANGFFIFHRHSLKETPQINHLVACRWTPDDGSKMDVTQGSVHELDATRPIVVYSYGQLGQNVLAATNTGGVYRFDGETWKVVYERPDTTVSFQVYAIINYYDRLLMGQYPTGELYAFDGSEMRLLKGWPPVMEGVSGRAREAQTAALYGGDLYVGVWPWAEVWRYDGSRWAFEVRMFSHPDPTEDPLHPYENEMAQIGRGYSRDHWGQRVTSLIPFENSLWISTSNKGTAPFDPRFAFLADGKWKEYGSIFRLTRPGHLAVHTGWKGAPTQFEFTVTEEEIRVSQDGELLGSIPVEPGLVAGTLPRNVSWGRGVYGAFQGKILEKTIQGEGL